MLRAVEARFFQDLDLPSPTLDVGCGDGHFASLTFERPLDVGLDPSGEPIRQAAKFGGYRGLVQADGSCIPFPDGYFASGVSNSVLEHIPRVQEVLAEISRVLKSGAPFVFSVPNPGYLDSLAVPGWLGKIGLSRIGATYTGWFRRMSRVFHAEPAEVWQNWLEKAGFVLERQWDYFSPAAMRVLELGHYFGAPTLLPHKLTGRWILVPRRWNLALTDRLVRPYTQALPLPNGTFSFFVARKD